MKLHQPHRSLTLLVLLFLSLTLCIASVRTQALTVRVGDVLSIRIANEEGRESVDQTAGSKASQGDLKYTVLSDGTIQGHSFGIIKVQGMTVSEITKQVRKRLAQHYKDPEVSVVIDQESAHIVYLSGTKAGTGEVAIRAGMDLRQLLAGAPLESDPDLYEAHLFRAGQPERKASVQDVLVGATPLSGIKLEGNDVVAILPTEFVRVWVTGEVTKPGQLIVKKGDDVYKAIASAGGASLAALAAHDSKVVLRRGISSQTLPLREDASTKAVSVESGDTIVVLAADLISVTVSGEVKSPGRIKLPADSVLDQAIASSGGLTSAGTGREVKVLRDGKELSATVATSTTPEGLGTFKLEDQDVILVKQNTRFVITVGMVNSQGRIYLPDGQPMHLLDVVVAAGGINDRGTSRHVYVGRPDGSGKFVIKEYRLDKFLKDGDKEGNPLIEPGDVVSVQAAKPTTLTLIEQTLSSAVLLYGVSKL